MINYQTYKELIEHLFADDAARCSQRLKKYPEAIVWLSENFSFTSYIPEMIYALCRPTESYFCGAGNKRKFRTITTGWNRCLDKSCSFCIDYSKEKATKTNMHRYGVSNPMKLESVKEKMKKTVIENHGSYEPITEKRKQTNLEKYGVDHFWKTDQGQNKRVQTMIDRYGVVNPSLNLELQEKKKKTFTEKYGVDHPMKNKEVKEKVTTKFLEKYGVTNPSKIPEVRKKRADTMLNRYGVMHASQCELFKQKQKDTMLNRYGVKFPAMIPGKMNQIIQQKRFNFFEKINERVNNLVKPNFSLLDYRGVDHNYSWTCNTCITSFTSNLDDGSVPKCPTCFPVVNSKGQEELAAFVESLGFSIIRNSRKIIPPQEIDIFVPEKHLAIEFNGIYWHSEISGRKDSNYHLHKQLECEKQGISLIHVYDIEWNEKQDLVKSRISQKLGLAERIYARNCQISKIDSSTANLFNAHNHIQGKLNSPINYGLFYLGELISVMSFIKSRYHKKAKYELARFCTKQNLVVVGGASKLLVKFEKDYDKPSLVSYCDAKFNTGNVYRKLGFTLQSKSKPNYWYFNGEKLESRIKYQKHKLRTMLENYDPTLSEWENMRNHNHDRIWDSGSYVFVKNL